MLKEHEEMLRQCKNQVSSMNEELKNKREVCFQKESFQKEEFFYEKKNI